MKHTILKLLALGLVLVTLLCAAGCTGTPSTGDAVKLSFRSAAGYSYLKSLSGRTVTISGYMATSSPVDGSFLFLMNLPYQSCPFCVPNTSQLSNTMEVYPQNGDRFTYTSQAIKVTGTLVVAENENEPFTDMYGYQFNYKIIDATYTIIAASELSADMALWQKIAESDVINDIYAMYDYLNFVCNWNTYFVNSYVNESGETVPGYFLYSSDAEYYLHTDGAQWNYGTKEEYYNGIIKKIRAVDPTAFEDLVHNIEKAKALSNKALDELASKNYTSTYQFVEKFGKYDYVYTLTNGEALITEMETIYTEFSDWLGSWEM